MGVLSLSPLLFSQVENEGCRAVSASQGSSVNVCRTSLPQTVHSGEDRSQPPGDHSQDEQNPPPAPAMEYELRSGPGD